MTKSEKYEHLIASIEALIADEKNALANLSNCVAVLHDGLKNWWTGFYLVEEPSNQLVLGPFQGPVACTRIDHNKGVCGTSWAENKTLVIPNVHEFPGHIACSAESNSEIVVPITRNNKVVAVLDLDSQNFSQYDDTDRRYLESLCNKIAYLIP